MVFSFSGLMLAAFIAGLPLIVKPVQSAIEGAAKELMEASFAVGAGKIATFYHVVLPTIKSSVIAGLILAFGRSLGEVGISLILGGNIVGKTDTVSLSILNAVLDGDFDRAWALSALLGVIALGIFWVLKNALSIKKIH